MHRQSARGYFPSGDPVTHLRSVPYARALGLQWERGDATGVSVRLPYSSSVRAADRAAIDPLATLGLLDHICSAAVFAGLDRATLVATLDLRFEFAQEAQVESDIIGEARITYLGGEFSLVRAEAICAHTGRCVACASSAYALGAHPGVRGHTIPAMPVKSDAGSQHDDTSAGFLGLLGLQTTKEGVLLPFHQRLIGAISLPALHGGVTGAAMVVAAVERARHGIKGDVHLRPLTLAIQYLRAVRAEPVRVQTRVLKRGSRVTVISAIAEQGTPALAVAQAECLLVRADAAAAS